jgi:hypothetical protein
MQFQPPLEIQIVLEALKFSETHKRNLLHFTLPLTGTFRFAIAATPVHRDHNGSLFRVKDLQCETDCLPPYSSEAISECMWLFVVFIKHQDSSTLPHLFTAFFTLWCK